MRDWRSLIEQRLRRLKLSKNQRQEIVTELAAHLEDLTENEKQLGSSDPELIAVDLFDATDWPRLARAILNARRGDRSLKRSRTFWLPALVTLTAAQILWAVVMRNSLYERLFPVTVQPSLVYFAALPLFGALGAYLSRRAGGARIARISAAVFPSIVMPGLIAGIFLLDLVMGRQTFMLAHRFRTWISVLIAVIVPGLALLAGSLPFLWNLHARESSPEPNN
jgi:hypothetical protein